MGLKNFSVLFPQEVMPFLLYILVLLLSKFQNWNNHLDASFHGIKIKKLGSFSVQHYLYNIF